MSKSAVILLIVAVGVAQIAVIVPVFLWLRRKGLAITAQMRESLAGELVWGPFPGYYGGASTAYSKAKGNAVLAVTSSHLECRKLFGEPIRISLDRIKALREDKWFRGSFRSGLVNLILRLDDGTEVAFQAEDLAGLRAAIVRER